MNTSFLLVLITISLVGILLLWLLYRKSNSTKKLTQNYLIAELKDKELSKEQRKEYEQQLSKILLQDGSSQNSFKIISLITIFILPFSLYFYYKLGNPAAVEYITPTQQQTQATANQQQAPQMSMEEAIKQLENRLAQNPDDVDGQMLYARSLVSLKKYPQAVTAYRKANQLAPNESVVLTELAEAIALANNNRSFLGEPESLLAKAVELKPNNQKALWLLGMTYYEHKNFTKTNEIWSKLYHMISDKAAKKQLATQLNDIRAKLGLEGINDTNNPQLLESGKINLTVTINLTEKLKENLKGKTALLYIYTKAVTGMPMPIAVVRKSLESTSNFPVEVNINNSNSLQPSRKLSDFNKIKIGARISFSGNAMPQVGDLQSIELIVNTASKEVIELTIDSVRN